MTPVNGTAIGLALSVVFGLKDTGGADPGDTLLLETGDDILLETGDFLLLE